MHATCAKTHTQALAALHSNPPPLTNRSLPPFPFCHSCLCTVHVPTVLLLNFPRTTDTLGTLLVVTAGVGGHLIPGGPSSQQRGTVHWGSHKSALRSSTNLSVSDEDFWATTAKHGNAKRMCRLAALRLTNLIVTDCWCYFFAKTSQKATLGLQQHLNLHLRSNSRKHSLLNKTLSVFTSNFGVFEKGRKNNVWLLQHDEVWCWLMGSGGHLPEGIWPSR